MLARRVLVSSSMSANSRALQGFPLFFQKLPGQLLDFLVPAAILEFGQPVLVAGFRVVRFPLESLLGPLAELFFPLGLLLVGVRPQSLAVVEPVPP